MREIAMKIFVKTPENGGVFLRILGKIFVKKRKYNRSKEKALRSLLVSEGCRKIICMHEQSCDFT
jgi:hypothetical protein